MSEESTEKAPFPFDKANIINDLLFTWIFPLTRFFRKHRANEFNIYELPDRLNYKSDLKKVKKVWKKMKDSPNANIFNALWAVLKYKMIQALLPASISYNSHIINSLMLGYIVNYINGKSDQVIPYIVIYSVLLVYNSISYNYSFHKSFILIGRIKSILTEMVFEKALNTYYGEVSQGAQAGKITSLISADLEFLDGAAVLPMMGCIPTFILGGAVLLWFSLGISGIIGLIIAVFHLPIILYFGKLFGRFRIVTAALGDSRMKMITNLIEGIRIIKLYGWENPYLDSLFDKRAKEIYQLRRKSFIACTNKAINYGSTGLVIFITFTIYVLLGNEIDPSTAFSSIAVLVLTTSLISMFGSAGITNIFLVISSMRRITLTLKMKEKNTAQLTSSTEFSVQAKACTFAWKAEYNEKYAENNDLTRRYTDSGFMLSDISIQLKRGELLMVVGAVGSGKTALFLGLLQEIQMKYGKLMINGEISYASEEPWIVSGTIRDNIMMGKPEDLDMYDDVINCCCLDKDLQVFKDHGDETMVGDRGITLSGGQKARVSLARAIYANKDIILLDDPLSAVDPEVCSLLFNECIKGFLREKTVILATHQAHFVSQADKILILDEGKQIFFGTYPELLERNLLSYLGTIQQTKAEEKDLCPSPTKRIERQATIKDKKSIVAEESAEGNVPFSIYWRFWKLGYKNPIFIVGTLLLQVIGQIVYLSIIFWVAYWGRSSDQSNNFYIFTMGILVGVLYILTFFRVFLLSVPLLNSCKQVHNLALKGLAYTESVYFDRNPTGRMLNRFAKDTSQIDEMLILYKIESIFSFCFVIGNFIAVVIILPYIVIVLVIVIIYFVSVAKYFNIVNKSLKRLEQVTKSPIISLFNSSINGLITIRCQNLQKKLKGDLNQAIEINYKTYCAFHLLFRTIQMYLEFGPNILGIINIIVLVSLKDSIQPGLAGMSISLTTSLVGYVGYLFKTIIETDNYMTSTQRLIEYQDLKIEGVHELNKDFKISKGKIEIQNLSMRYRSNYDYALKNLSFTIKAGSKTGIVGRTGAGKSSIMQVLFRLTDPEEGTILIDGQDYLLAGLHDLRKQMSVIPQSATLFIASLRDNLDPFHEHSDKEIEKVLKQTRLGGLLDGLDKGLDTEINSAGLSLSAGQKQLVCLARAILRKNKIVMIDEATANVDSETDAFIQQQLDKKFKGSTLIVIAHRLRTVIECDWIIVMDKGTSIEEGSPKKLAYRRQSSFLTMINHTGPEESEYLKSKLDIE